MEGNEAYQETGCSDRGLVTLVLYLKQELSVREQQQEVLKYRVAEVERKDAEVRWWLTAGCVQ